MEKVSNYFGMNLFSDPIMRERLPKNIYMKLQKTIKDGSGLEPHIANVIANAMKDWAIEQGATHYTHWFQPMTGRTGEKHEAFITIDEDGVAIEEFSGKNLIVGESDASSFPNGGLRATFEARGYTTWDCTSPAFIKEGNGVKTLCIPTAFCSYTGEALDKKTPLLRSMQALELAAKRILRLFGSEPQRIYPTVGAEQEYFLIDKRLYQQRLDLIYSGRTLFGAQPPKGQELSDHYYGTIRKHIMDFMKELDHELWKLGVLAKTRHYEVAPAQYELAPVFATVNIAVDQNQLVMETLEDVANRHELVCLLHEKPFAYFNGSGKHNNWSIITSEGVNLFEPGKTPHENLQFLVFFSAVVKAIDQYAELIRVSASSYSNDFRLGGHEAPPAIISMFIGSQMEDILEQIENGDLISSKTRDRINTGVITLPELIKDVTDRNRTSPFAFTGNKFEFRMVGSSQTVADPNIVLNTIVADSLNAFADVLEKSSDLILETKLLLQRTIKEHKRIIFNGNGYSHEWVEEAERRGLPILNSTVDALPSIILEKSFDVFMRNGVLTRTELLSRYEVRVTDYIIKGQIEARTMVNMMRKEILPGSNGFLNELANTINNLKQTGVDLKLNPYVDLLKQVNELIQLGYEYTNTLDARLNKISRELDTIEKAKVIRNEILDCMKNVRTVADQLEVIVPRHYWPFPTYGDLVFRS